MTTTPARRPRPARRRGRVTVSDRTTGVSRVIERLRADRWAAAGIMIIVVFVLAAVFASAITAVTGQDAYKYDLDALDGSGTPVGFGGGISATHWFGVEPLTGRDLFSIVIFGARTSLLVSMSATILAVVVGVLVGITTGFFGGWYDRTFSRVIDVLFGFPSLVFMISLTAIVPTSFSKPLLIILVIGFFGWPSIARVVRGETLSLRERNFVVAATAMGATPWQIISRQILPNVSATIIVFATISIPSMIGVEAALSFLGVGVPPPTPSWGRTIGDAVTWVQIDPLYLIFPGTALFLITLAFNVVGDGLRDALDPRWGTVTK